MKDLVLFPLNKYVQENVAWNKTISLTFQVSVSQSIYSIIKASRDNSNE